MRIVAASDLHGQLPDPAEVPHGDVLALAGDLCPEGAAAHQLKWLATTFSAWLERLPVTRVVATWGNHDWVGMTTPTPQISRVHWLVDAAIELGGCRFWGSPWSLPFFKWAFMRPETELAETWAQMPDDTDVVIVHGPPKDYGDRTILRANTSAASRSSNALSRSARNWRSSGTSTRRPANGRPREASGPTSPCSTSATGSCDSLRCSPSSPARSPPHPRRVCPHPPKPRRGRPASRLAKAGAPVRIDRYAGVAQLVRARGSYPRSPGFKSLHRHQVSEGSRVATSDPSSSFRHASCVEVVTPGSRQARHRARRPDSARLPGARGGVGRVRLRRAAAAVARPG